MNVGNWLKESKSSLERKPEPDRLKDRLKLGEKVIMYATQSRWLPGTAKPLMPKTIYLTSERVLIRTPTYLGAAEDIEDYYYSTLTNVRLEKGLFSSTILLYVRGLTEMSKGFDRGMINGLHRHDAEKIYGFIQDMLRQTSKDINTPTEEDIAAANVSERYKEAGDGPYG